MIVLDPVNGAGAGGMVTSAQDADIPVIAYDRFIAEADYYMSFDNETVGKMQGEALVEAMGDEGSILMLNGAPSDPNAAQFKAGAHSVIDESNVEILAEFDNPDWSPGEGAEFVNDQLSNYDPSEIQGVYAANDGQAGGVVAALTGAGVAEDDLPPITGQDAELAAIQRIIAGQQAMTIYKPIPIEAETAAEVAVKLADGEEISGTSDTGIELTEYEGVPSFIFDPIVGDRRQRQRHGRRRRVLHRRRHLHRRSTPTRARRPASADDADGIVAPVRESVLSLTGVNKRFGAVQALTDVSLRRGARRGGRPGGRQRRRQVHAGQDHLGGLRSRRGRDRLRRQAGLDLRAVARPSDWASPRCSRTWPSATTSTSSPTCSSGRSTPAPPSSTRCGMEKEAWRLLRTLSAKIPSVRIPIASLSGGQRQTVAIARSLVGKPKVVMLDEPTAALGVAQTAEVLNLVERLRETGLGVILISHNMADVQAVADRIVVLRLGRNAADFRVEEATTDGAGRGHHRGVRQRRDQARVPHRPCPRGRPGAGGGQHRWLTPRPARRPPRRSPPTWPTSG